MRAIEMGSGKLSRGDATIVTATATIAAAADQLTKSAAFDIVAKAGEVHLLPVLTITTGMNSGVAFGMATAVPSLVLIAIAIAICGAMLMMVSGSDSMLRKLGAGAIVGGACGNIVDRVRFDAVRDFIDAHWGAWHWPAFNLADTFITVGVLVLLLTPDRLPARAARTSSSENG